jgi:hypothetical protein
MATQVQELLKIAVNSRDSFDCTAPQGPECLTVVEMNIDIGATDAQSSELDVDSRVLSD